MSSLTDPPILGVIDDIANLFTKLSDVALKMIEVELPAIEQNERISRFKHCKHHAKRYGLKGLSLVAWVRFCFVDQNATTQDNLAEIMDGELYGFK